MLANQLSNQFLIQRYLGVSVYILRTILPSSFAPILYKSHRSFYCNNNRFSPFISTGKNQKIQQKIHPFSFSLSLSPSQFSLFSLLVLLLVNLFSQDGLRCRQSGLNCSFFRSSSPCSFCLFHKPNRQRFCFVCIQLLSQTNLKVIYKPTSGSRKLL